MDQPEPFKWEPPEIDRGVEISDLPEAEHDTGRWSARLYHAILWAQRPERRILWVRSGMLCTVLLAFVAALVIFSSLRANITPARPSVYKYQFSPTVPPTRNYAGFTYLSHPHLILDGYMSSELSVAWSPDGRRVAAGGLDEAVQIWDAQSGTNLLTYRGHSNDVEHIAWSPDGTRIASVSRDATVQVWDAKSGKRLFIYRNHGVALFSVAWSPDGTRIASGSIDWTVQVWDARTGNNLLTYHGHAASVYSVAWSPDGKRIASGSSDGTAQIWSVATGERYLTILGTATGIAWSPNALSIVSGGLNTLVEVWQVA